MNERDRWVAENARLYRMFYPETAVQWAGIGVFTAVYAAGMWLGWGGLSLAAAFVAVVVLAFVSRLFARPR